MPFQTDPQTGRGNLRKDCALLQESATWCELRYACPRQAYGGLLRCAEHSAPRNDRFSDIVTKKHEAGCFVFFV